jgi:hypothetical protein
MLTETSFGKTLLVVCMSNGPIFIVIGASLAGMVPLSIGTTIAFVMAIVGGLMTQFALMTLYRRLLALESRVPGDPSESLPANAPNIPTANAPNLPAV